MIDWKYPDDYAEFLASRIEDMQNDEEGRKANPGSKVKCLKCNDIIQSMYRHDFKWCSCKNIAVDGGGDYLKMSYQTGAQYEILQEEVEP